MKYNIEFRPIEIIIENKREAEIIANAIDRALHYEGMCSESIGLLQKLEGVLNGQQIT